MSQPPYPAGGPPPGYAQGGYPASGGGGGGGGGHGNSAGDMLKDVGGFLSKNKAAVGTALFNYKMGGGLGKMFAAGQAADLANRYSKERGQHHHQSSSSSGGGYSGGSGSGHSSGLSGAAAGAIGLGKQLLGKAEKLIDGKSSHQQPQPAYAQGGPETPPYAPSGASGGQAYPPYGTGPPSQQQPYTPQQPYPPQQPPPHQQAYPAQGAAAFGGGGLLPHGATLSLVSTGSGGRAVQIVMSPTGQLVVDAQGSPGSPNALWSVVANPDGSVSLHNGGNFLGQRDGLAMVEPADVSASQRPPHLAWRVVGEAGAAQLHSAHYTIPLAFDLYGMPKAYAPHGDSAALFVLRF